jgi:hypothetical protein
MLMTAAGLALADSAQTDYDHGADFSRYKTFMWIKEPVPANEVMKQRIIGAINAQLQSKGLRLVAANADIGVSANTSTREQQTLERFYSDFPGWGWHRPWAPVNAMTETYGLGTLVVDLFDTRTKQVTWWSRSANAISEKPAKDAKKLTKAVKEMFQFFPPPSTPRDDEQNNRYEIYEEWWETATCRNCR